MAYQNRGFPVASTSHEKILKLAVSFREFFELPNGRIDLATCFENMCRDMGLIWDVRDDFDPSLHGHEAWCIPEHAFMVLSETTYANMLQGRGRALFTIMHEIGHYLLGHTRTVNREHNQGWPIYQDSEWQADTFAAEATMPLKEILDNKLFCPEAIKNYFGVSFSAATTRIGWLQRKGYIK